MVADGGKGMVSSASDTLCWLLKFIIIIIIISSVCFACVYMCALCVCSAQKRALDPFELEYHMVVSWESNSDPQCEQPLLSPAEQSPSPCFLKKF